MTGISRRSILAAWIRLRAGAGPLVVSGAILFACVAPERSGAVETIVSGRVTDHLTGAPMGGLRLSIYYDTSPFSSLEIGAPVTSADGTYSWTGTCPAPSTSHCYVHASADGHLYMSQSFRSYDTDVTLDFALLRAASVSGDFAIDGVPADHDLEAVIEFYNESSGQWASPAPINYEAADGHFALTSLPFDHTYRVCAGGVGVDVVRQCYDGHEQTALSVDPAWDAIVLSEGEQRSGIDFDFSPGGAIEGTVHDAYLGTPIASRQFGIMIYDETGERVDGASRTTDANGMYRVAGLPDGTYYVAIAAADDFFADGLQVYPGIVCPDDGCNPVAGGQSITIANGSTAGGIDFTLHPDVVIEGRVTDANGAGLGGIHILALYDFYPDAVTESGSGDYRFYVSHNRGSVRVYTRDSAPLIDQVYPAIPCLIGNCFTQGQALPATTGTVYQHIDFSLGLGSSIAGHLSEAATGRPLIGTVQLYDAAFNVVWFGWSDENGAYASGAWQPGTYYAQASGGVDCLFYDAVPCPANGGDPGSVSPTAIVLTLGEVRRIDFLLRDNPIFASGFDP